MDSQSKSESVRKSNSKEKEPQRHKLFVTSLDGTANETELHEQLKALFEEFGQLKNITVRKSKNGDYSFAFVEYELGLDAQKAIEKLNKHEIRGKQMKVQYQDDSKRRKDPEQKFIYSSKGCYTCGKMGHFARECRSKNTNGNYRSNRNHSRSRSRSGDRKKRRRSPSDSSEKERSRHKRKKEKKDRSRDKDEKKKKKHKKRRDSSDDSRS